MNGRKSVRHVESMFGAPLSRFCHSSGFIDKYSRVISIGGNIDLINMFPKAGTN